MINKAYFFPDDEYCDEWDMPFDELISQMHTASADEIREYGV